MRRGYVIAVHGLLLYVVAALVAEVVWSRLLEDRVRELRSRITGAAPPSRGEMRGMALWDW